MSARYRSVFIAISLSFAACADDSPFVEGRDEPVQVEDGAVAEVDAAVVEEDASVAQLDAAITEQDAAVVRVDAAVVEPDAAAVVDAAVDAALPPVPSHLPCDVEAILAASCQRCHGPTAKNGVPLMTRADLLAPAPKDPTANVITRVLLRAVDAEKPMPPVGKGEPLSEADRAVLENWVNQSSPAGDCE